MHSRGSSLNTRTIAAPSPRPVYRSLYNARDDLDQLMVRRSTFTFWPSWATKSVLPEDLAQAGFYYTGDKDEVRCFKCQLTVSDWTEGTTALGVHQQRSPSCDFVRSRGSTGVTDVHELQSDSPLSSINREFSNMTVAGRTSTNVQRLRDTGRGSRAVDASGSWTRRGSAEPNGYDVTDGGQPQCNAAATGSKGQPSDPTSGIAGLRQENETLRATITCRHCNKAPLQTLFLPCAHLATCEACGETMDFCIVCQQRILGTVRIFMV